MKKIARLFALISISVFAATETFAQCEPDTVNCIDTGNPGQICPRYLPEAMEMVPYDEVITVIAPANFDYLGIMIDIEYIVVDSVLNLPSGIDYQASATKFYPDSAYCIQVAGIPAEAGVYPLLFYVTPYVNVSNNIIAGAQITDDTSVTMIVNINESCISADINIDYSATSPSCYKGSDGSIDLSVDGTFPIFSFQWSTGEATEDLMGLAQGQYTVVVTDSAGCSESLEIQISDPPQITISDTTYNPLCYGDSNGSIKIEVSNAAEPYLISWFNDVSLDSISGLSQGWYLVSVTDAYDCIETDSILLIDPDKITISDIIGTDMVVEALTSTYSVTDKENYIFRWMVEGGNIISGQGTHIVDIQWGSGTSGLISVLAESEIGCLSDTSELSTSISLTGFEKQHVSALNIYPNPTSEVLTIETKDIKDYSIEIKTLNGQILYHVELADPIHLVDLRSFQKGIYVITVSSEDFVTTRKVIKY